MGNQKITPTNFVATVYGNLTPLNNSAFSKARLKIFYKGLNRNGSYITDETAEQMLSTLPGVPIVGTFNGEKDDFEGHMWDREQSKAYGFVPQEMNFNWEMFLDPDGVYRTYACVDVILWTGRYPIASRIVGKSHSMELNGDTIKGDWVEDEEIGYYYKIGFAEFIGLCVLGEDYEPCFEGSSFYELNKETNKNNQFSSELQEMFSLYKHELDVANENQTGGQSMEEENKDLVVDEELETTTPETEPETHEEETVPTEENEDTVVPNEGSDESDDSKEETSEDEVEEEEKSEEEEEEEEESEEESQPDLNSQLAEKDAEIASLKAQLEELNNYKAQKILEEKEQVIETYSNKLSEEEIESFKNKIGEYENAVELKKEIALCILDKEDEEETEENDSSNFALLNNRGEQLTGVEAIVAKYAKKN